MLPLPGRTALLLGVVWTLAGCTTVPILKGKSPLRPPQMSADSCVLEVFFVRFPLGDPEVNGRLWQEVDEQHFPAQLRQRLARNGFRVGVLGGPIPIGLSKLLELGEGLPRTGEAQAVDAATLQEPPCVVRRHLQLRAGQRSEVVASGVYDELPVLICEPGQLSGQTYRQAVAVLAVKTFPQGDGRVRLELVPELHHDEPRQRWVGGQGTMRLDTSRPRRVFADMAVSATLSPGGMLLATTLPSLPGSLGYHFFTETTERREQKLLVIRLAQTQHDELFSPAEVLDLEQ